MGLKDNLKKAYEEGKEKGKNAGSFSYQMEKMDAEKQEKSKEKEKLEEYDKDGIPYCTKCHSTSVQYVENRKKLSVGRAVVGGTLFGGTGAVLGGLTSKKVKGKLKCLKCGHEWKI
ncbi:hypothetical protein [Clostridium sp.]|uniref:hypothetical protein n=1 Tax=Clostridium sp. TaxID=1506 RepID=UPI002617FECB|nr:hypothetical protein [Clostridium sp.]